MITVAAVLLIVGCSSSSDVQRVTLQCKANEGECFCFYSFTAGVLTISPVDPNQVLWPELLQRITQATQQGRMDTNKLNEMLTQVGITGGVPMLATRPDLYGWLIQELSL